MITEGWRRVAPAKINLTLHVTGQRADGYHLLDSLVVFADFGDHLTYEPGPEMALDVSGPFADGVPCDRRNLVWQAGEQAGLRGRMTLEKRLPHGAGLGGGSADAAAVLCAAGRGDLAEGLGADVPVCLAGQAQRMQGIGERLTRIFRLPPIWAVLVNPGIEVPTPAVFRALTNKQNPPMPTVLPTFENATCFIQWLASMRNDLAPAAISAAPAIEGVLASLDALPQAALSRMSGSGSTCFALFEQAAAAQAAAKLLAHAHPEWWVQPCALS